MKRHSPLLTLALLLGTALLLACTCSGSGLPFGLFATPTSTPTPTATPTLTPSPTPTLAINLGNVVTVQNGGFSFRPVIGYRVETESDIVYISSPNQRVLVFMAGAYDTAESDANQVSQEFLNEIRSDIPDMVTSPPLPVYVSGIEGLATDLSGTLSGTETAGRLVVVMPYENQYFISICLTNGALYWESEGRQAFEAMLATVTFFSLR